MNEQILKDAIYKMNAKGLLLLIQSDLKKHTFEEISTIGYEGFFWRTTKNLKKTANHLLQKADYAVSSIQKLKNLN